MIKNLGKKWLMVGGRSLGSKCILLKMSVVMDARAFPKTSSITEEEYNLCMRQFESIPNLLRMLASAGKLPSWVVESSETYKE